MSRDDYKAISKIIEDVVGENTLMAVKLLEGIKFYLDNKMRKVRLVKPEKTKPSTIYLHKPNKEAEAAMKRYTAKLEKENAKYRKKRQKENCSISS
jgi:hypothetical protein